ncbi:unnamed protein product [Absidia cylindrospora]
MTIDVKVEQVFKDLSCNDTQKQQTPFQVVLVDIKKAARNRKIHCVEKSLEGDLKFVALSYRWGELHEKMVDTQVGYLASITSFDMDDFYYLCSMMTKEADLKDMDYVWVDAICVDQTNDERRKTTIHQMSNIYKHANYILAVPDLHLAHLKKTITRCNEIVEGSGRYYEDIYHLIHGNFDRLVDVETQWLDTIGVPKDPALRTLLTEYTNHFTDGLTTNRIHEPEYHPEEALEHIFESAAEAVSKEEENIKSHFIDKNDPFLAQLGRWHTCNQRTCPLSLFKPIRLPDDFDMRNSHHRPGTHPRDWKRHIHDRSNSIRRSMHFMADLIKDWSSRVWVISEYSIAKKKNNLKYWFIQLKATLFDPNANRLLEKNGLLRFFEFKFDDPSFSALQKHMIVPPQSIWNVTSEPVYITFHQHMIQRLVKPSFLEMMLVSKAKRNEDRFYAVFPLFDAYKHKLQLVMEDRHIDTMVSVKLTLFDVMTTNDKLTLLFLTADVYCLPENRLLPTFATVAIQAKRSLEQHRALDDDMAPCNFDVTDQSTILLQKTNLIKDDKPLFYLHVKPIGYYATTEPTCVDTYRTKVLQHPLLRKLFSMETLVVDLVWIPIFGKHAMDKVVRDEDGSYLSDLMLLVGSFVENKWVLAMVNRSDVAALKAFADDAHWTYHEDKHRVGFHIY